MSNFNFLFYFYFISISTLILRVHTVSSDVEFEGLLTIQLEHSFSDTHDTEFVKRGNVSIQTGISTVTNLPLTLDDCKKLQLLSKEDKFYTLRATVLNNDGLETQFLTSIKSCILTLSNLNDYLNINMDHSNNVVGISIGAQASNSCQGAEVHLENISQFTTKVYIIPITIGPIPDTASYIQKLEREREAKERGDVKDNRSFLAKYWMYIVPVVILMVLSSAANPDGSGGRQTS